MIGRGSELRVARDDICSCIFPLNEELFRTPESSKSHFCQNIQKLLKDKGERFLIGKNVRQGGGDTFHIKSADILFMLSQFIHDGTDNASVTCVPSRMNHQVSDICLRNEKSMEAFCAPIVFV